ncbi:NADH:ubiquinone oxidoreductase [Wolbachia pipientis]|uniref:NADH:ubiquinone oxidoreductase n=1 Tax=Wolbachia pipientis TaxID=955 RepID=A0A1E7QJY0_WOLPI|nr:zinc-finger domain-containing protein [Wolbachia pipientis]OEY86763.1 NADH:ubiquinone oxidoreductase [Wolbachia pipientis]
MQEIKFSEAQEIKVNSKKVCCNGRNGNDGDSSGHPIIYLDVEEEEPTRCPYCSQVFVYDCTVEQIELTE